MVNKGTLINEPRLGRLQEESTRRLRWDLQNPDVCRVLLMVAPPCAGRSDGCQELLLGQTCLVKIALCPHAWLSAAAAPVGGAGSVCRRSREAQEREIPAGLRPHCSAVRSAGWVCAELGSSWTGTAVPLRLQAQLVGCGSSAGFLSPGRSQGWRCREGTAGSGLEIQMVFRVKVFFPVQWLSLSLWAQVLMILLL